ncbi:MAG: Tol-Pal system beta propeller repeat protein TolB [Gammaproteobacteria bacterium]
MAKRILLLICFVLFYQNAHALLEIEITQGSEGALPIAVVPFYWEGPASVAPVDIAQVISSDLYSSGRFKPLPQQDMLAQPHTGDQINFRNWRILGVENMVVGSVRSAGSGYIVQFQLFDVFKGVQVKGAGATITVRKQSLLRKAAHQISDIIFEKLTGVPGAFATRIAYVTEVRKSKQSRIYTLIIADSDGYNPHTVLRSKMPLMSPAWSPDGRKLAYVSFELGVPQVYIHEVGPGKRELVSSFKGINGAPAWSPNGKKLALALSKDGSPDIYVLELASRRLTRLTRSYAIDTEPVWSPDGNTIVFTSDRGGKPQLYRADMSSRRVERVTYEGSYNARAAFSPDGKFLAMVHRDRGNYRIAVMELESGTLRVLTDGRLDESPSFAPNGSMVTYATEYRFKGVLSAVSVDGSVKLRLKSPEGDAREPAWSPYRQ